MGRKVLFVCYGGGHVASCLPVATSLRNSNWNVQILALTTAYQQVANLGWNPLGFKDFLTSLDEVALRNADFLMEGESSELVSKDESRAYLGLCYQDLVDVYGHVRAFEMYKAGGRHIFLPVPTLKRIISSIAPDVVVTTGSPRAEYAAQLAAYELGIRRVCILDLPDVLMVERLSAAPPGMIICAADNFSVLLLLSRGFRSEHLKLTGNPAFDSLQDFDPNAVLALRQKLKLSEDSKLILWASQIEPATHPQTGCKGNTRLPEQIEAKLREWVGDRKDSKLIVRYHPNEVRQFVKEKNVFLSKKNESLVTLLNACDIVVTMTSTVALQAKSLKKSVLSIDLSVFSDDLPLVEMGISKGVSNLSDLSFTLDDIVNKSKPFALGSVAFGSATKNICQVIEDLNFSD